jgi:hypothetical protein
VPICRIFASIGGHGATPMPAPGLRAGSRFDPSAEVTRAGHTLRSRYVDPYDAMKRFKATVQIGWSLLGRVQVSSQLEAFG